MPKGSPINKKMLKRFDPILRMAPEELRNQIDTIANAERFFSIPAKVNGKYVLIVGMVLSDKVDARLNIDLEDFAYLMEVVKKVQAYLASQMENNSEVGEGSEA